MNKFKRIKWLFCFLLCMVMITPTNAALIDENWVEHKATTGHVHDGTTGSKGGTKVGALNVTYSGTLTSTNVNDALEEILVSPVSDHGSLTSVTADQHQAKSHIHDGIDGSGTVTHSDTTGIIASDHHSKTTSFGDLVDSAIDDQIPNSITIDQATNADTVDGVHEASFILENGTRAFSGNQSLGDNSITNVGDIALDSLSPDTSGSGIGIDLGALDSVVIDARTIPNTDALGALRIEHTAGANNARAITISIDANSKSDTMGIAIEFAATGMSSLKRGMPLEITIDTANASGGTLDAMNIEKVGTGTLDVHAIHASEGVIPVHQESGTFAVADNVEKTTDESSFTAITTASTMFDLNNDYVYFGHSATYNAIEWLFNTVASGPGIRPEFYFSTGAGTWTEFFPGDSTSGCKVNGQISWELVSISGTWVLATYDSVSRYWIKIKRTRVSLGTVPILNTMKYATSTQFLWDENGDVNINTLALDGDASTLTHANQAKFIVVSASDWTTVETVGAGGIDGFGTYLHADGTNGFSNDHWGFAQVHLPIGAVITRFNVYGSTAAGVGNRIRIQLISVPRTTTGVTILGDVTMSNGSSNEDVTGLSVGVISTNRYLLKVITRADSDYDDATLFSCLVYYTTSSLSETL